MSALTLFDQADGSLEISLIRQLSWHFRSRAGSFNQHSRRMLGSSRPGIVAGCWRITVYVDAARGSAAFLLQDTRGLPAERRAKCVAVSLDYLNWHQLSAKLAMARSELQLHSTLLEAIAKHGAQTRGPLRPHSLAN